MYKQIYLVGLTEDSMKFSCYINQSLRYVPSCLKLIILNEMSNNNPCHKSVVLESPNQVWAAMQKI